MPLAKGDVTVRVPEDADVRRRPDAVVIAIAPDPGVRVRLAELVSGHAAVLLVSSREQALAFLNGGAGGADLQTTQPADDRGRARSQPTPVRQVTGLHLDSDRRLASWAGQSLSLSPLEHDLLLRLLREPGHTSSFAELHQDVWGNPHLGSAADVHSVVKRVRRKLRLLGSPLEIETVRGVGLRLVERGHDDPQLRWRPVALPDQGVADPAHEA